MENQNIEPGDVPPTEACSLGSSPAIKLFPSNVSPQLNEDREGTDHRSRHECAQQQNDCPLSGSYT